MSDIFVSMNSEEEIYDLAEIDSDVVIGNLLSDIKQLQAENADLQDKLEDEGFVLVMGRDEQDELERLREENAELKKQSEWISVDDAMRLIDAEDEDHANVRSVVERMIAAGYRSSLPAPPEG